MLFTKFNPSTLFLWTLFIFCRVADFPCCANTVGGAVMDKAEWFPGIGLDLCLPFSNCLLPSLDFWRCCLIICNSLLEFVCLIHMLWGWGESEENKISLQYRLKRKVSIIICLISITQNKNDISKEFPCHVKNEYIMQIEKGWENVWIEKRVGKKDKVTPECPSSQQQL